MHIWHCWMSPSPLNIKMCNTSKPRPSHRSIVQREPHCYLYRHERHQLRYCMDMWVVGAFFLCSIRFARQQHAIYLMFVSTVRHWHAFQTHRLCKNVNMHSCMAAETSKWSRLLTFFVCCCLAFFHFGHGNSTFFQWDAKMCTQLYVFSCEHSRIISIFFHIYWRVKSNEKNQCFRMIYIGCTYEYAHSVNITDTKMTANMHQDFSTMFCAYSTHTHIYFRMLDINLALCLYVPLWTNRFRQRQQLTGTLMLRTII